MCLSILEKELRIIKQTRRENSRKIDKYGSIKKKFQNSDTTYALWRIVEFLINTIKFLHLKWIEGSVKKNMYQEKLG